MNSWKTVFPFCRPSIHSINCFLLYKFLHFTMPHLSTVDWFSEWLEAYSEREKSPKVCMSTKRPKISKAIMTKNNSTGETANRTIMTKAINIVLAQNQADQWNKTEDPNMSTWNYSQLILDKGKNKQRTSQEKRQKLQ